MYKLGPVLLLCTEMAFEADLVCSVPLSAGGTGWTEVVRKCRNSGLPGSPGRAGNPPASRRVDTGSL